MRRAQKRDSVHCEKFYFRNNIFAKNNMEEIRPQTPVGYEYTEMSINSIINGKVRIYSSSVPVPVPYYLEWSQDEFPGLVPLVREYVNGIEMDLDTRCTVTLYLQLISERASGERQLQLVAIEWLFVHQ